LLYWFLKWIGLGPALRVIWRPWIEGRENVPARGGAILASNHLSFCDSFFMPLMMRRRVTFLAKAEYFTSPGIKGFLSRLFFSGVGQVPIDRTSGGSAQGALITGSRVLGEGRLLGIYPEGTRSPDGRLYRGKTGVARLALQTGCPIVPIAMIGTDRLQPPGQTLPRLRPRPGARIGPALDAPRTQWRAAQAIGDAPTARRIERELTDALMKALADLSGQEYVDEYAADVKARIAGPKAFGAPKPGRRARLRATTARARRPRGR
jgi:1-acyl-sn-glycerol-3-phosphate acyltransferase